jgi:hypothetical protein
MRRYLVSTLEARKNALQTNVDAERAKFTALYHPEDLLTLIQSGAPEANEIRLKLRSEIRKRIEKVSVLIGPFKDPWGNLAGDKTLMCHVKFVNGSARIQQIDMETGKSRAFKAACEQ